MFAGGNNISDYYHPPTKLQEGNVFTGVCHSVQEGYAWSQVPSGWSVGMPGPRSLPWGMGIPGRKPTPKVHPGMVHPPPPRKVHSPVLTSGGGHLIGGMLLTGMLPSNWNASLFKNMFANYIWRLTHLSCWFCSTWSYIDSCLVNVHVVVFEILNGSSYQTYTVVQGKLSK